MIWLVIWGFISTLLLGFSGWFLLILYQQKKSWKAFAEAHKLRYKANPLMEGPEMHGVIDSYKFSFFSSEHFSPGARTNRKLTAIEVNLHSKMAVDGGIASGGMIPFIQDLQFKAELRPGHEDWSEAYLAAGDNRPVLEAYMTDERIRVLSRLMKIKNAWVVFIFRNDRMLLRVDIADPLFAREKLEKLVKLLVKAAQTLEVSDSEYQALKTEEIYGAARESSLVLEDSHIEQDSGLVLEEDAAAAPEDSEEKP